MADTVVRLSELIRPQPKQQAFLDACEIFKFILYGGAAGGGKSYILRWWLILFLIHAFLRYGVRNVRVGLFCEDYPALKDRQLSKIATEFPSWLGDLKDDRSLGLIYRLKPEFGGGFIALRNLDDPGKYDSTEFAAIAVDELGKNKVDIFDQLRKRLRWPSVPAEPSFPPDFNFPFAAGTNPGGVGHSWIKAYWIDKQLPKWLENYKDQFAFIPALATDNKYNPASYYEDLKSLPPLLAQAYAEGRWDLFAGQYFQEWRGHIHVIEPFELPHYWTRIWGGDWGYSPDPFCGLWAAVDDTPEQNVFVYREVYGGKILPEKWAQICIDKTGDEQLEVRKLDPKCWGAWIKKAGADRGPTIAESFSNAGWHCSPADNQRILGWTKIREYLDWEENENGILIRKPHLFVFSSCVNLIRTLPTLIHDEFVQEDVQRNGLEDHAPDALRYLLMSRPSLSIQPLDELDPAWQEAAARAAYNEEHYPRH